MEKMGAVLITLLLFIGAAVAEEAGNGKAINPVEDASVGEAINPVEDARVGEAINPVEDARVGEAINPVEDASVGEAINPVEDARVGEAINPVEDASVGEAINPVEDARVGEAINPVEDARVGEAINPVEDAGIVNANTSPTEGKATNLQAYKSPRFKKFVTLCSSHAAQTCSGNDLLHHEGGGGITTPFGLSFCLFDSMEKCLVDHEASLIDPQDNHGHLGPMSAIPKSIQYQPLFIETTKFRTVLKTCTHVSAQSCFTAPNVATSVLAACLMPSLNRCVYPAAGPARSPVPPSI